MDIAKFLLDLNQTKKFNETIINFQHIEYSPSLFSHIHTFVKTIVPFTFLDVSALSIHELKNIVETSFLGQSTTYWLKNYHDISKASRQELAQYLTHYKGLHSILLHDNEHDVGFAVSVPNEISKDMYNTLYTFFNTNHHLNKDFISRIFRRKEILKLDEAAMLFHYQNALGKGADDSFYNQWLPRIIDIDISLFTLSQNFFAQQPKDFFAYWFLCVDDYPYEFWVAYWAEQLWQAALFVYRAQTEDIVTAKKFAQRLPFSFINKDYKRYTYEKLVNAHNNLYKFDHMLKNGGPLYGLEVWFWDFFKIKQLS